MSRHRSSEEYDVIIIGAGIGGLVCGCYLAKAGMKVLICEQHHKPGGYCTSFKRKGFTFDAAAHCFGSYREDGFVRKIFKEIGITEKIKILRYNPSDIIVTPDYRIMVWNDIKAIKEELQHAFPSEAENINNFISFALNPDPKPFATLRNLSYKELLDQYFKDRKLKTILSFPIAGNGGLPSSKMSAFVGIKIFTEYILDGGYYPENGMQELANALTDKFQEHGGELRLSCMVKKINLKGSAVKGITTKDKEFIPSKNIVSNADARMTYLNLIGSKYLKEDFKEELKIMEPSISTYIAYLGLDSYFDSLPPKGANLWFLQHYDLDRAYNVVKKGDFDGFGGYMLRVSPLNPSLEAFLPVPYINRSFWRDQKKTLLDFLIKKIERYSIKDLSHHIVYKDSATPYTLHRYTLNYRGASFGWASTPSQIANYDISKPPFLKGVYLTGHWTTLGIGISGVCYVGKNTANLIIRKYEQKRLYR